MPEKQFLEGYITYVGAFIILVGAFVGFLMGKLTFIQLNTLIGAGIAIVGARRAIKQIGRQL